MDALKGISLENLTTGKILREIRSTGISYDLFELNEYLNSYSKIALEYDKEAKTKDNPIEYIKKKKILQVYNNIKQDFYSDFETRLNFSVNGILSDVYQDYEVKFEDIDDILSDASELYEGDFDDSITLLWIFEYVLRKAELLEINPDSNYIKNGINTKALDLVSSLKEYNGIGLTKNSNPNIEKISDILIREKETGESLFWYN